WWPLQLTASRVTEPTSFRSDTLGGWDTPHGELLHPSPDLCIVDCHHHGAGRSDRIAVPSGGAASRGHTAAGRGLGHLSGRQRGGGGEHCNDAIGTTDQRRAGHDLHVLGQ